MARCWVRGASDSGYDVDHLPYGVFAPPGHGPRVGARVGGMVLDLAPALDDAAFALPALNPFLARGPAAWAATRARLQQLLTDRAAASGLRAHLYPIDDVELHLPWQVADYVDFYSSLDHATNLGRLFRPDGPPLLPNWRVVPVGYHGRAGSVVVSGTPVVRPCGVRPGAGAAAYGPSLRLDVEVEVGFVVGPPSRLGAPVGADGLATHVFGLVLLNDWSARDIQAFEYQPLGPFLGKSFATSVAAWVTPLAALDGARVPGPVQEPPPLPHLARAGDWGLDLALELAVNGTVVARPPFATTYWTPDQQLAHLTSNGSALRTGDLFASGTVSGPRRGEGGSLIELTANGSAPLPLDDGTTRAFLDDGDTVAVGGSTRDGRLVLGEVVGTVQPAQPTVTGSPSDTRPGVATTA